MIAIGRAIMQGLAALGLFQLGDWFGDDESKKSGGWIAIISMLLGAGGLYLLTRKRKK